MSNLVINANSIYDRVIRIGRQTENLVSSITFNVQMWIDEYGAGECVLNVKRNGDVSAYIVPMTITDGMTTWTITDADTARKGRGEIQLKYTTDEKVKTSPIFTIFCEESLVGEGEPPSGHEDWLAELNRMTAQVEAAKTSASASAQSAQTAAGTAAEKASEAEQSATTASGFAVNASASAESANTSAQAAAQSAQAASVARTAAESAAISAQAEAEDAEAAKTAAEQAETNAHASEQTASESATQAAESAAQAQESATDAQSEADRAKTYADRAAEVELEIPTKVSQLENDAGYLTEHQSIADYVRKDVLYNMLPVDTASGHFASFPDGADDIPLKSLVVDIEPVQDTSSGVPSPDNICPISGWTGANVQRTGANLADFSAIADMWSDITQDGDAYRIETHHSSLMNIIKNMPPDIGQITLSYDCMHENDKNGDRAIIRIDYTDGTYDRSVSTTSSPNEWRHVKLTSDPNKTVRLVRFSYLYSGGPSYLRNIMCVPGTEEKSYEPYIENTYPITFPTEAGTVYGGMLDVTTGVLTVTKGFIQSYNGETLPSTWISDRDVYAQGATPTTGAEVCYDLATPITYQLTPTEIKSLLGQNNILANTGDTTVEYRADTSAYVAKKIAEAISALS